MAGAIQGLDRVAPSGRLAHPTQFDQLRTAAAGVKSRASQSRMAPRTSRYGASQDSAASPSPNVVLSRAADALGHHPEAVSALLRAVNGKEPVALVYEELIDVHERSGNIKEALGWTDKASRVFADDPQWRPHMPRLCQGVLVSLIYNQGHAMADPRDDPGSRKEMRDARDAVAHGRLIDVPNLLRAMTRLWPEGKGLRDRREREALLEEGLKQHRFRLGGLSPRVQAQRLFLEPFLTEGTGSRGQGACRRDTRMSERG